MQVFLDEGIASLVASDDVLPMRDLSLENSTLEQTATTAKDAPKQVKPAARAKRSAEQLRFRLKEAMAQRGSSEAFLHWLSTDGGKQA
ncbi:MAG TPA: hypothetical protein VGF01_10990 [Terracidiphilus sp.]